jgi:hypothetical protein
MLIYSAGSGKSTLMKHIASHPSLSTLLPEWAGTKPDSNNLIIAKFFFYYLGTELQKSQEGLIRGLLHQILAAQPSLTPRLLPELWEEALNTEADLKLSPASHTELWSAFERLGELEDDELSFCIFIDGLDEYLGKPSEGVAMIQSLIANPRIKVMVSSRPIQPCFQAWSGKPSLKLHDLTYDDISTYVNQTVGSHIYMETLSLQNALQVTQLKTSLVDKAEGVFLWVVLACRSVSEGLDNFDRISDLQKRVLELPPQLEALFIHMLAKIELRYRESAAKIILLAQESLRCSPSSQLPALGLAIIYESDFELDHKLLSHTDSSSRSSYTQPGLESQKRNRHNRCKALEAQIRSICCGLIELRHTPGHDEACFCEMHPKHDEIVDSSVDFLHRTVVDYLNEGGSSELRAMIKNTESFNHNSVLASLWLGLLPEVSSSRTAGLVGEAMVHMEQIPLEEKYRGEKSVFDFLQDSLIISSPMASRKICDDDLSDITSLRFGLPYCLAVELDLANLLRRIEALSPDQVQDLRDYGLQWPLDSAFLDRATYPWLTIAYLLDNGAKLPVAAFKRPCWSNRSLYKMFLDDVHDNESHLVSGLLRNTEDPKYKTTIISCIERSLLSCTSHKTHPDAALLLEPPKTSDAGADSLKRSREEHPVYRNGSVSSTSGRRQTKRARDRGEKESSKASHRRTPRHSAD